MMSTCFCNNQKPPEIIIIFIYKSLQICLFLHNISYFSSHQTQIEPDEKFSPVHPQMDSHSQFQPNKIHFKIITLPTAGEISYKRNGTETILPP